MPDRYADAVRARRAELRALRAQLTGGHRTELRSALALSRVTASAEISAALAALAAQVTAHLAGADRADRRSFPDRLGVALDDLAARLPAQWAAAVRPTLLRIGTARGLPMPAGWPALPVEAGCLPMPVPERAGRLRAVSASLAHGIVPWRLSLVVVPLWGMPALGGRALAPLAAGAALAAVAAVAHARLVAAERARLRRFADTVLAAAGVALAAELGRRLIQLEASATAALDAAAHRRQAEVTAELARLARAGPPDGPERCDG
ncbi:MAG TPA: hypothetical protein VNA11_08450 [Pseudonocardia sp.]|nr:hypothetical protein [Pseudonocardia sp.]